MATKTQTITLLGLAALAWIAAAQEMRGMDGGPGTALGPVGWFLGVWAVMTLAMMLPSATPAAAMFSRLRGEAATWPFLGGYLAAWMLYGVAAYAADAGIRRLALPFLAWDRAGAWIAGGAIAVAGLYQLTPLKQACLRRCRSPLGLLVGGGPGARGAARTGVAYGSYCVGCCAGLMLALFAIGVMSVLWMAIVAAVVVVEKLLPRGESSARAIAAGLLVLGLWVALSPASAPGLRQPMPISPGMQR